MLSSNWTTSMYGIDDRNTSDLLIEYLIKSNEIGVKSLLMNVGIMANTQAKQIMGLRELIASGDEKVIAKVVALDPNTEIHEEAFKLKYAEVFNHECKTQSNDIQNNIMPNKQADLQGVTSSNKLFGGTNISIVELLLFLLCAYIIIQIIKH